MSGPSRELLIRRDKVKDARIAELEVGNAELRKQNEILTTARRLEETERKQAEATIRQMTNSLRAIREEHEDIPALVKFIDGELSRWAERGTK